MVTAYSYKNILNHTINKLYDIYESKVEDKTINKKKEINYIN